MSKKIDRSLKALLKAFRDHAKVVGGNPVSLKKAERAVLKVQTAMSDYSAAVQAKTGLESSFIAVPPRRLDDTTLTSLAAERDSLINEHYKNGITTNATE
jgi:hypothetical protein